MTGMEATEPSSIVAFAVQVSLWILVAAALLASYRALAGPSHSDRVVALDLIGLLAVAATGTLALRTGQSAFLDAAIVIALVAFLSTVAYARLIEYRGSSRGEEEPREASDE